MLIVAVSVLLIFWLRDYMLLRMSPRYRATRCALLYGAVILLTAVVIGAVAASFGLTDFARLIQSAPVLFMLIAFHLAASVLSLWLKQSHGFNWMWATALIPTPIVWFFLLETTLISGHGVGIMGTQFSLFTVAVLWGASMIVAIVRTRQAQMPLGDLDFAVLFGSLSHCLAICVLPLAFAAE